MTNKQLRQLLAEARYTMPKHDQVEFRLSLNRLKEIKPQSRRERMVSQVALAAAAALLLVFTMPPLVRAVGEWVDRVFKSRLDEVAQYQAMTEEEKRSQLADPLELKPMEALPVSATGEFEGVTMRIANLTVQQVRTESGQAETILSLELEYADFPPFDPNWIDFSLTAGGQEYENRLGLSAYRDIGVRITDAVGWRDTDFDWFGHSRIINGVPTTDMSFAVPASALNERSDMTLTGRIDGQVFSLTIPFDPAKLAVAGDPEKQAQESLEFMDQLMEERKEAYEALDRQAVPLKIDGAFHGKSYHISEIAFVDGLMFTSVEYAGQGLDLDAVVVDGYSASYSDYYDHSESGDGGISVITPKRNPYAAGDQPEESLFVMQLGEYSEDGEFEFSQHAFRYHWATQKVTLPADAEQEAAWVDESSALQGAIEAERPYSRTYDLTGKQLTETIDGLGVRITGLRSEGELVYAEFKLKYDKPTKGLRVVLMDEGMNSQIDEKPAPLFDSMEANGLPYSLSLVMPLHFANFGEGTKLKIDIPLTIFDLKDEVVLEEVFTFEFTL